MSETEVPQVRTSPYASPMHQFGSAISTLTNPDNELYKLELTLRSMRPDGDGVLQKYGEPLMNEAGISNVLGQVQTFVNQDAVMSHLEEKQISSLMIFLGDTLAKDLMMNRETYGIKDVATRDKIYFITLGLSFVTLRRSFMQGERVFWGKSFQEINTRVETEGGKKGFFSNPFSKK